MLLTEGRGRVLHVVELSPLLLSQAIEEGTLEQMEEAKKKKRKRKQEKVIFVEEPKVCTLFFFCCFFFLERTFS